MDTVVFDSGHSTFLVSGARLVTSRDQVDLAASVQGDWDIDKSNPFVTWIAGDFVEGDNPNSNKQFWTAGDLEMAEYTIKYAPLNMVHKYRQPVGFYAATRTVSLEREDDDDADLSIVDMTEIMVALRAEGIEVEFVDDDEAAKKMPTGANAPYEIVAVGKNKFQVVNNAGEIKATFKSKKAARAYQAALYANVPGAAKRAAKVKWTGSAKLRGNKPMQGPKYTAKASAEGGSMKIQALSGMWSHLFPFETAQVEKANDDGLLFYSMECRGSHLICAGPNGCGETFDYGDPASHCAHLMERSSIRHIVNPIFRGGALIVPPVRPGWKQANASIVTEAVMAEAAMFAEQTEEQYASLAADGVDISASGWETLMAMVIQASRV